MHELGIVFHVADTLKGVAAQHGVTKIGKVVLRVGEVSTVINEQLIDCWNWNAKRTPLLEGCELEIEQIKAVTYCEGCKGEYETVKYGKICPLCGSERTYLLRGNEFEIKEILAE